MAINNNSKPRIREYVDIFFRRKWLFIIPFVSVFTLSLMLCFLLPSVYQATVKMEVNGIFRGWITGQFGILTERLFSRVPLEKIIKKAGLDKNPLFIEKMIRDLRENTHIQMIGDYLIRITYDNQDRATASKIAKIIAETFIKEESEESIDREDLLTERLRAKLVKLEDRLVELLMDCKEDHPMVIDVKADIEETKEEIRKVAAREEIEKRALDKVRLEREARISEGLYKQLPDKLEAVRINQRLKEVEGETKFRIIDPDKIQVYKIKPNNKKTMVSGFMFAILLGIALIALVEYADHSFRGIDDAKAFLTMPILGLIPKIVTEKKKKQN